MKSIGAKLNRWIASALIVSTVFATPAAVAQEEEEQETPSETGLPVFGESLPPSKEAKHLGVGEAAAAANRLVELGMKPDAGQLIDISISIMSMAMPVAGGALVAAKAVMGMLGFLDKPDPVQEALKLINKRLAALEQNVKQLSTQLQGLQNTLFYERNYQQIQRLLERHARVAPLGVELEQLRNRSSEPTVRVGAIAEEAAALADRFLFESDRGIWDWSDLRVFTHPETRELVGHYRAPEFKPLPTFEYYAATLALWMTAIEFEANSDVTLVRRKYGKDLMRHVAFLSSREEWRDLNGLYGTDSEVAKWALPADGINEDSLQENIAKRVACELRISDKYPVGGLCRAAVFCSDRFTRTAVQVRDENFRIDDPNALCMAHDDDADKVMDEWAREPFSRNADLREWKQRFGTEAMTLLARKLAQLARYGTTSDQFIGTFSGLSPVVHYLYAVGPGGEVSLYEHFGTIDRSAPSEPSAPYETSVRDEARAAPPPPPSGIAVSRRGGPIVAAPAPPTEVVATKPIDTSIVSKPRQPPIDNHHMRIVGRVADDWDRYAGVFASGSSGIVGSDGTCLYALTPAGELHWYRHDGFMARIRIPATEVTTPEWSGPTKVGEGWNRFTKIVAGGEGVLYGIQSDGALYWYRHTDVAAAQTPPQWASPQVVGSGWQQFVHVFTTGGGILYGVTPDGRLLWYRHKGYRTGAPEWEGPNEVGTGWAQFTRLFSGGDGGIYALTPSGELLWYNHQGHQDGSAAWQGPLTLATNWSNRLHIFPRLASPLTGSDIVR